jgi:hypothetical protein
MPQVARKEIPGIYAARPDPVGKRLGVAAGHECGDVCFEARHALHGDGRSWPLALQLLLKVEGKEGYDGHPKLVALRCHV